MNNRKCFVNHLGPWLIEERWFVSALTAIKANQWPLRAMEDDEDDARSQARRRMLMGALSPYEARKWGFYTLNSGIATIHMIGPMMKGDSKYGGVNSVLTRQIIRCAVSDDDATSILLCIDSPGGEVAGLGDAQDAVRDADAEKPVYAHIDDLGASAAWFLASQARRITVNATGQVGSVGTVAVVEDSSAAYEMAGAKVHVLSTGEFKGAFASGTKVLPSHLAYLQKLVTDMNALLMKKASLNGRVVYRREVMDGRLFVGRDAQSVGLVDAVRSMEDTYADLVTKYIRR